MVTRRSGRGAVLEKQPTCSNALETVWQSPDVRAVAEGLAAAGVREAWLVGGLLRDRAAGRTGEALDIDIALRGSAEVAAKALAPQFGGSPFVLDEAQGAWRIALPNGRRLDLVELRAADIRGDLEARDFTVNALAWDLLGTGGLLDPLGGLQDLSRRRLALCSSVALDEDPVRVLRAYRFSFGLDLAFAEDLGRALGAAAPLLGEVAPERVRTELFAILALDGGARALRTMAEDGVLEALFPFVASWRGFDQGDYHAHDLLEHSFRAAEAVEDLIAGAEEAFPEPEALAEHLEVELEAGITRASLLKAAAFFHDLAKPDTLTVDGTRRRFLGHDVQGGHRLRKLLAGLRVGRKARAVAQRVVAAHLRLFALATQTPPTRTARLRYLRDMGREVPEALILSLADEIATGPEPSSLTRVTVVGRELLALHWDQKRKGEVAPLLRGRDLLEVLQIPEGPLVGDLLRRVAEAEARGEVGTRADALHLARRLLDARSDTG